STRRAPPEGFRVLRYISSSFPKLCLAQSHRPKDRTVGGNRHPPKCEGSVELTRTASSIGSIHRPARRPGEKGHGARAVRPARPRRQHDLAETVRRLSGGSCEYLRVTTRRYREVDREP